MCFLEKISKKALKNFFGASETFRPPRATTMLLTENKKIPDAETFFRTPTTTVMSAERKKFYGM